MKCLTHTLTLMLVLVMGFLVGARYQRVLDNVEALQSLTAVQKNRISELHTVNSHLASVVRLHEILAENRIYLSRSNVEAMASRVEQVSRKYGVGSDMIYAVVDPRIRFK